MWLQQMVYFYIVTISLNLKLTSSLDQSIYYKRALQKEHEKPQEVKWMESFFGKNLDFNQVPTFVNLINYIAKKYLSECTTIILYDKTVENSDGLLLEQLFKSFPTSFVHGQINKDYKINTSKILKNNYDKCIDYILFVEDALKSNEIIGEQNINKVIIVARSSQWRVYEFLGTKAAQSFVNLLVISQSEKVISTGEVIFLFYI